VVCPPFTRSRPSRSDLDSNIRMGAQNMSEQTSGAYTRRDCGLVAQVNSACSTSSSATLNAASNRRSPIRWSPRKALAAHAASINRFDCVGETLPGARVVGGLRKVSAGIGAAWQVDQRRRRKKRSLRMSLLWAIATASTQLRSRAQDVHSFCPQDPGQPFSMKPWPKHVRIQYGGSDKSSKRPRN